MKRLLFGAATVAFGGLLALVLIEGGLRLYSAVVPNADVEFVRYASLMKSSAPESGVRFMHQPGRHLRLLGVDVRINSRGFRDAETSPQADSEIVRLALLGDSITFGWGVPYGQRFSEILERSWSAEEGVPFEIINTGHGNYNAVQEFAMLNEFLDDEPLDGVLQIWYVNDAEPTPEPREAPWYSRSYLAVFLWSKSDLLRRRAGSRESYVEYYRHLYGEGRPGVKAFEAALARTGAWTRARGLPWVFVILPEFHNFDEGGPFEQIYRRVAQQAAEAGARVVDATRIFRNEDPAAIWVARNDVHPNARGHALIARAILENVEPGMFRRGAERSGGQQP